MLSSEMLKAINEKRKLCQIGFLTRDIKKSMQDWIDFLQVGPWRVVTLCNESVTDSAFLVDGALEDAPYKFYLAISYIGEMQVELIQPVYGPTIYQKFINERGEGIHHYKEQIRPEDWDGVLAEYERKGMRITQKGTFGLARYAYVDSDPLLNFVVELSDNVPNPTFPEGCDLYYFPEE